MQALHEGAGQYAIASAFRCPTLSCSISNSQRSMVLNCFAGYDNNPTSKCCELSRSASSEDIFDINKAYQLGANSFLVKPLEFVNFPAMMRTLGSLSVRSYSATPKLAVGESSAAPPRVPS